MGVGMRRCGAKNVWRVALERLWRVALVGVCMLLGESVGLGHSRTCPPLLAPSISPPAPPHHTHTCTQVRAWPSGLVSASVLVDAVSGRMKRGGPGSDSRELWLLLAHLHEAQVRIYTYTYGIPVPYIDIDMVYVCVFGVRMGSRVHQAHEGCGCCGVATRCFELWLLLAHLHEAQVRPHRVTRCFVLWLLLAHLHAAQVRSHRITVRHYPVVWQSSSGHGCCWPAYTRRRWLHDVQELM